MADNVTIPATGSGSATPVIATDDAGAAGHVQIVKLAISTDGSATAIPAEATNGLDVDVTRLPALVASTANIGDVDVLTVPAPLSTTGGGTEATALRVTVASDSTGVVSVDDNGASLTIDTAANTPVLIRGNDGTNTETTLFDLDSGVGTQWAHGAGLRKIASGGSVEAGTATDPLRTDPTGTTTQPVSATNLDIRDLTSASDSVSVSAITSSVTPGTAATNLGKAEDSAHASLDVGVMALVVANEANTARAADGDYLPPASDTEGNIRLVGNRDHDAADAGEVVKVGGVAVSGSATPTPVAAADRVRWIFHQHGIPYILGGHPNLITREFDFGTAAQTDLNLAEAVVAADERIYVTGFEAMCDNANTVAVAVRAGFGATVVPTASATGVSGMIASHPGIAAGSGIVIGDGTGIIAVGAAGSEPRLTSGAATSGNLHVIIRYFLSDETP